METRYIFESVRLRYEFQTSSAGAFFGSCGTQNYRACVTATNKIDLQNFWSLKVNGRLAAAEAGGLGVEPSAFGRYFDLNTKIIRFRDISAKILP